MDISEARDFARKYTIGTMGNVYEFIKERIEYGNTEALFSTKPCGSPCQCRSINELQLNELIRKRYTVSKLDKVYHYSVSGWLDET